MASGNLNILVIGAGMYVCGKGTSGFGTVFPAICEWSKLHGIPEHLYLAATSNDSVETANEKLGALNQLLGTDVRFRAFPEKGQADDPGCYHLALKEIPRPACAILVVPDHLHYQIAMDCLRSGVHVLVVKPLTASVPEARRLIETQQETGLYGAVEFHKRFDRANLKLKEAVASGAIGRPLYFVVEYSQRKRVPSEIFRNWVHDTNIFQYLGVHYVDIIYFVTGARPRRVMAKGQDGWLKQNGIDAYDAVHGVIEWEDPAGETFLSFILTNWIDPDKTTAMSDQQIKLVGTRGRIESNQKNRGLQLVTDEYGVEDINPDFCQTYPTASGGTGYRGYGIDSIHTFLSDVNEVETGNVSPAELEHERPTFQNALISTMVVEAVNRSLKKNGAWIDINPISLEKEEPIS